MNFTVFQQSLKGMRSEAIFLRTFTAGLCLCLLISLVLLTQKSTTTILVPPNITEKMELSTDKASGGYKKAWGLFVSQLLGNVSQGNAEFVLNNLQTMMEPEVFNNLKRGVTADVALIKQNALILSFEPRRTLYENATSKVFVSGTAEIVGLGASMRQSFDKTFEMKIEMSNNVPIITYFDTYKGEPRTLDYLSKVRVKDQP